MHDANHPLIELRALSRIFTTDTLETHAVSNIDLEIGSGEYIAIEGPSGCGKSTLLHLLGLLDDPSDGQYRLAGVPTAEIDAEERARLRNQYIGFVFQSFNLITEMTVAENVMLPLLYRPGLNAASRRQMADRALEKVGMLDRINHRPAQLSGGQQQRVAIARAVVGGPSLILADEPTGNLDQVNSDQVMSLLESLQAGGTTVVIVTHNPDYGERAGRRLRMLDGCLV